MISLSLIHILYIDMKETEQDVRISMKNVSSAELNFNTDEITDRFVRGDVSRNTEGSGLGLAIVKSFVELQHGTQMCIRDSVSTPLVFLIIA